MERNKLFEQVKQIYGIVPDYPWRDWNAVLRAYHMNKDSWISIALDGSVPADTIMNLVDISYQLTTKK